MLKDSINRIASFVKHEPTSVPAAPQSPPSHPPTPPTRRAEPGAGFDLDKATRGLARSVLAGRWRSLEGIYRAHSLALGGWLERCDLDNGLTDHLLRAIHAAAVSANDAHQRALEVEHEQVNP